MELPFASADPFKIDSGGYPGHDPPSILWNLQTAGLPAVEGGSPEAHPGRGFGARKDQWKAGPWKGV